MSFPYYELYFSQSFVEQLGRPSSLLTPVDLADSSNEPDINGTFEDTHGTRVLGAIVPLSNPDPNCTLSMNTGQLNFPGVESHSPGYNSSSAYQSYEQPAQYDQGPYSIPLEDTDAPPLTPYFDASQAKYVDQSVYRTDWGLQTHPSANSHVNLPQYHIYTETLNRNVSQINVREILEEPGFPPTSGYESSERYLNPPQYPVAYFSQSSRRTTITTDIQTAPQIIPYSHDSLPSSFTFNSTSYPVFPMNDAVQPAAFAPASYPSQLSSQDTQPQYCRTTIPPYPVLTAQPEIPQAISTAVIPPTTSPDSLLTSTSSSPITPLDAIPLPPQHFVHPALKRAHSFPPPPSNKHPQNSKEPASIHATSQKPDKKKLTGRLDLVRSWDWIDRFFPNKGPCTICVEDEKRSRVADRRKAKAFKRTERKLEHLVSSHIFQAVKKKRASGKNVSTPKTSIVKTEAQFSYARQGLNEIKCSICPTDTSLVFRERNIKQHLRNVHMKLPKRERKKELDRLLALIPDESEWYSYQDKFLYSYPGGCPG